MNYSTTVWYTERVSHYMGECYRGIPVGQLVNNEEWARMIQEM